MPIGAPVYLDVIELQEAILYGQRVEAYRVEVEEGGAFRTVHAGTTIGHRRLAKIDGKTASKARVVIESAKAPPAIRRVGLYRERDLP